MRSTLALFVVGLFLSGWWPSSLRGDPPDQSASIKSSIAQLGDRRYLTREAASKHLMAIGAPAMELLQAATSSPDYEIRWRVQVVLESINKTTLATEWDGDWSTSKNEWFRVSEGRWSSGTPQYGPYGGTMKIVKVQGNLTHVDLVVDSGPTNGQTVRTILRREGEVLHYCGTYSTTRPQAFTTDNGQAVYAFQRITK